MSLCGIEDHFMLLLSALLFQSLMARCALFTTHVIVQQSQS